jgi:putative PIN family toxin of toxin-antitoxin system
MALSKVVLDTCVIESALRSKQGASFQILARINGGQFHFGISTTLFLEYESRARYCKAEGIITISHRSLNATLAALAHYGDEVPIYYRVRPNLKNVNDDMVFECSVNYGADYLVTHNTKDFLQAELKGYPFQIITPQQFLTEVLER